MGSQDQVSNAVLAPIYQIVVRATIPGVLLALFGAWVIWKLQEALNNVYFHPLSKYPGPKIAAATRLYHAFIEWVLAASFQDTLQSLHAKYGNVVRVGPNELHFSDPQAYQDIYNNKNRWDKEQALYHSFGEDRSSFGFLTYEEAKPRKDVLNKMFSAKAISEAIGLVEEKVNTLCDAFEELSKKGEPADLFYGFRCMTMDIVTYLCFGKSLDAMSEPGFRAPVIVAMDASQEVFVRFKHSDFYKNMIVKCPLSITRIVAPQTMGLIELQQILMKQINDLSEHPENMKFLPHSMTIYHTLMSKESYKNGTAPDPQSLYDEAQALLFAGADTVGNALMIASFYLARDPERLALLKKEIRNAAPEKDVNPSMRELERLPYLNGCIKEVLRLSQGVVSGLLRITPAQGATIAGVSVPGGVIVSCASPFVHLNADIFPAPLEFKPERWIEDPSLDNWLVAFSKGPRSCLGINLAWVELRMTMAAVFRRFDVKLHPSSPEKLVYKDRFLPMFIGPHVKAFMTPSAA
ncbi:MAG: hypothetical protein M1831_002520 [Alyxoria varia]|nr:MAG: hypothetical protein M1831_002520 [Alyxoria varia]